MKPPYFVPLFGLAIAKSRTLRDALNFATAKPQPHRTKNPPKTVTFIFSAFAHPNARQE